MRTVAEQSGHGLDRSPAVHEHRAWGHGGLRAAVFGASDGLVSNMALVLGVAAGTGERWPVVLAGVAGLFAGSSSMAVGEWVSVTAQKEALENELRREADHLARYAEDEAQHLTHILTSAGLSADTTRQIVDELRGNPRLNLDFHARIELGIDPGEMGSPTIAATSSFVAFCVGALLPLVPFLLLDRQAAVPAVMGLSGVCLFAIGAVSARFTHRAWWTSGFRQLALGAVAAATTMIAGHWVGTV